MDIKNRYTGKIIFSIEGNIKKAVCAAIKCDANLSGANLSGVNLDFSAWGLSCRTLNVKAGDRLVAQLFFHWARLDVSQCSAHVRYAHRVAVALFGKYLANLFCQYRSDVHPI